MKKWGIILMILILLLSGCGNQESVEATQPPTEATEQPTVPTEATEPTGYYQPESPVETQTGGALRAYPLGGGADRSLILLSGNPVIVDRNGTLTLLEKETGVPMKTVELGQELPLGAEALYAYGNQLACYRQNQGDVIVWDENLEQIRQIPMPKDMQGLAVVNLKNSKVYYCVEDQIRALDMESGLSALIRTHTSKSQALVGSYFDGDMLACQIVDERDQMQMLYLSAETGQLISDDASRSMLHTYEDSYFAVRWDGIVRQQIFGKLGQEPKGFFVAPEKITMIPSLSLGGIVTFSQEEPTLTLYDLESGLCKSRVTFPQVGEIVCTAADTEYFWFLASVDGTQCLYRWDPSKTEVDEETVYTGELPSLQNPDMEGLALCQQRADSINAAYGVRIRIWQNALEKTNGLACVEEYQVEAIHDMLDALESVFEQLPDWFLTSSVPGGRIYINLVRSMETGAEMNQFWDGRNGVITISATGYVERAFLTGLGRIVDTHVIGNSRKFDTWDKLNPEGFEYAYDYNINAQREDLHWLEGEDPAFLNAESMSFPTDERSQLFYYAMSWEGEGMFDTPILQEKLILMCKAIREAYGWEKRTETYPWEQYLQESLAYKKK